MRKYLILLSLILISSCTFNTTYIKNNPEVKLILLENPFGDLNTLYNPSNMQAIFENLNYILQNCLRKRCLLLSWNKQEDFPINKNKLTEENISNLIHVYFNLRFKGLTQKEYPPTLYNCQMFKNHKDFLEENHSGCITSQKIKRIIKEFNKTVE